MKVIDVLNKIANGEEVPKKIIYGSRIYEYKEDNVNFLSYYDIKGRNLFMNYVLDEDRLNDYVDIIEEDKKIPEKIIAWYEFNGTDDKELTKIMLDELKDKYNEIIDYLNKEKNK